MSILQGRKLPQVASVRSTLEIRSLSHRPIVAMLKFRIKVAASRQEGKERRITKQGFSFKIYLPPEIHTSQDINSNKMSAIGSLVFCTDCGNLLEPSKGTKDSILKCECCGTENEGLSP
jgi:hypothetical protein